MLRFVLVGQRAKASPDFLLIDVPSTSGRLDVLLRGLAASMLVSHGLRRNVVTYMVLTGPGAPPRTLRFDAREGKYIRPDERSLAVLIQKSLAAKVDPQDVAELPSWWKTERGTGPFFAVRPGVSVAEGGFSTALGDLGPGTRYVLDEHGTDVRTLELDLENGIFLVGDDLGFAEPTQSEAASGGFLPISIGPMSLHADQAIVVLHNEIDRRRGLA